MAEKTTIFNMSSIGHFEFLSRDGMVLSRRSGMNFILPFRRNIQCESKKIPPPEGTDIFHFFHKRLRIFNPFFTHLLYVIIHARLQIFIQLSPILTKLCYIKRDYRVHIICSKCPQSAETHALTRLRKSLNEWLTTGISSTFQVIFCCNITYNSTNSSTFVNT